VYENSCRAIKDINNVISEALACLAVPQATTLNVNKINAT